MKNKLILILLVLISTILVGCQGKDNYNYKKYYLNPAFSINPEVTIVDKESKLKEYDNNIREEMSKITDDLDSTFNIFEDGSATSVISEINEKAGKSPVKVNKEVIEVIKTAIEVIKSSFQDEKALYDITILPIWELWGFEEKKYGKPGEIPSPDEIQAKLDLVDYNKIEINENEMTVFLEQEGMKLDLGSIVKGYAADKLKTYLLSVGFENAIINVGGNILTMGYNYYNDAKWTVKVTTPYLTILDPDYNDCYFVGTLYYNDITAVTSGVYERYIINDGKEYHHILDPTTGYPIDSGLISTTILTDKSIMADALSTAVFSLGLEKGIKYVEELDNVDAIFITDNYEVYITSGLKDNFIFNTNLEEKGYTYKGVNNGISN